MGKIPSYLKNTKDSRASLKEFEETKKKFDAEKYKLMKHQVDVKKIYQDCQKASEKASQVFDESLKFVAFNDEGNLGFSGLEDIETVFENMEQKTKQFLDEFQADMFESFQSGDKILDSSNLKNFVMEMLRDLKITICNSSHVQSKNDSLSHEKIKERDEIAQNNEAPDNLKEEIQVNFSNQSKFIKTISTLSLESQEKFESE